MSIEIEEMYTSNKILAIANAINKITECKNTGKSVGLCHGGFDLLHPGHMKHFESAKQLCDVLIVSITSDKFVESRKGTGRPVYSDKLRAYSVACISFVDYVIVTYFEKGVDAISLLKPSFYIKGPDYINKKTPGINAEREAIALVNGEMRYTREPPMSTTKIIEYVKKNIKNNEILVLIDRDGTLIKNNDFLGKSDSWKENLRMNTPVVNFLSYLQTKYKTTKIVITNQAGVARGYYDCDRVEEIHKYLQSWLVKNNIWIDNWQYCPNIDSDYAKKRRNDFDFNKDFVKEETRRKPNVHMAVDALNELKKNIKNFDHIVILGDRHEDEELANNLKAKFIDVKGKDLQSLVQEFNKLIE